jgi:hypothetical protein
MVIMKNPKTSILRLVPIAHGHNPAKVPKFNIRHDGILSIGNFMQMINNHFARFQLPGSLLKTKKCAPYFRGNTQFPIYHSIFNRFLLNESFSDPGFGIPRLQKSTPDL